MQMALFVESVNYDYGSKAVQVVRSHNVRDVDFIDLNINLSLGFPSELRTLLLKQFEDNRVS